jgi:hypothetical protein
MNRQLFAATDTYVWEFIRYQLKYVRSIYIHT